jgi:hypothetical protein
MLSFVELALASELREVVDGVPLNDLGHAILCHPNRGIQE